MPAEVKREAPSGDKAGHLVDETDRELA